MDSDKPTNKKDEDNTESSGVPITVRRKTSKQIEDIDIDSMKDLDIDSDISVDANADAVNIIKEELEKSDIDDAPKPVVTSFSKKPKKKIGKIIFHIVMIIILLAAGLVGGYFYRDMIALDSEDVLNNKISELKSDNSKLDKQIADLNNNSDTTVEDNENTVCPAVYPSDETIENIKASITSGNTAALTGYLSSNVTTILAASEMGDTVTAEEATSTVTSFVDFQSGINWSFEISDSEIEAYRAGDYGKYISSDLTAISDDGKMISFKLCGTSINSVFMSNSLEIL